MPDEGLPFAYPDPPLTNGSVALLALEQISSGRRARESASAAVSAQGEHSEGIGLPALTLESETQPESPYARVGSGAH
jgi:hypothetical protein